MFGFEEVFIRNERKGAVVSPNSDLEMNNSFVECGIISHWGKNYLEVLTTSTNTDHKDTSAGTSTRTRTSAGTTGAKPPQNELLIVTPCMRRILTIVLIIVNCLFAS